MQLPLLRRLGGRRSAGDGRPSSGNTGLNVNSVEVGKHYDVLYNGGTNPGTCRRLVICKIMGDRWSCKSPRDGAGGMVKTYLKDKVSEVQEFEQF